MDAPFGSSHQASGTVRQRMTRINYTTLEQSLLLEVLLDDGRYARATSTYRNLPDIGSKVALREETNLLGYHHYYWDGPALAQPEAAP